jgi:digeranylgeranylglycerophospholipid reductase
MGYPKEFMIGYQVEVTGFQTKNRMLEMFTGDDIAPGFFAWAIPNGDTYRIGMWSRPEDLDGRSCEELLNYLMTKSRWANKFVNCKEIGRFCGPIPAGVVTKPVKDRILLIGDAAGLAKPTTGGGIGPGMAQVDLIVEELNDAIIENNLSQKKLLKVTKGYSQAKKEFERIRSLRDFFVSSRTDEELEEIFRIFSKPNVIKLINEKGDIEKPLALGISMLKNVPEFRMMAIKAGFIVMFSNK